MGERAHGCSPRPFALVFVSSPSHEPPRRTSFPLTFPCLIWGTDGEGTGYREVFEARVGLSAESLPFFPFASRGEGQRKWALSSFVLERTTVETSVPQNCRS